MFLVILNHINCNSSLSITKRENNGVNIQIFAEFYYPKFNRIHDSANDFRQAINTNF